jgi:1,4-dihydroxy-2-naphthoate octaprenyltransferase
MGLLRNMLTIRRVEFLIAEIPICLIPLVLAGPVRGVEPQTVGLGVVVFFLLFNFGDMTNCLADRDLDATYKPRLSRAIYALTPRFVAAQILATAVAAVALTVWIASRTRHWLLLPLVLVGLSLGAAYSLPPVQLKARGVLQVACLWTIIFVGPMIFMATLLAPFPSRAVLWVALAYATVQAGIVLINTAEDLPEDHGAGIRTTIVALGLSRGLGLARLMVLGGGVLLVCVLAAIAVVRGSLPVVLLGLLPLCAALAAAAWTISGLCARLGGVEKQDMILVRRAGRFVPAWLTGVAWTTLLAAWSLRW